MSKEELKCPKCGELLSASRIMENGELTITIWCEWCSDYEGFIIKTGLKTEDIKKLSKPRKAPLIKEMRIV